MTSSLYVPLSDESAEDLAASYTGKPTAEWKSRPRKNDDIPTSWAVAVIILAPLVWVWDRLTGQGDSR